VFSTSGFHLLNGGQDEFLYSSTADHMLKYQYQGGPFDTLQPRPDHWLYDFSTRQMAYTLWIRHSAEIFLATVTWVSGRSTAESFPITVILAMLSTSLALVAILKICLHYRTWQVLVLQGLVFFSFYHFHLHIAGSLANLCSMGLFLSATPLGFHSLIRRPNGRTCLAAILMAGTVIYYSEVSLLGAVIPLGLAGILFFTLWKRRRQNIIRNTVGMMVVFTIVSHQAISTMTHMVMAHLHQVEKAAHALNTFSLSDLVHPLGVQLGIFTYYSLSARNQRMGQLCSAHPGLLLAFAVSLLFFGFYGILKQRKSQKALLIAPSLFFAVAVSSFFIADALRLFRSIGYIYPYLLIGLVGALRTALGKVAAPFLLVLCILNTFSTGSTLRHIYHYTVETEPSIRRFNPNDSVWALIKDELHRVSQNVPVLITDFEDTVRPHWITMGIEPAPSWLGASIRKFWHLMDSKETNPYFGSGRQYAVPWDQAREQFELNIPEWKTILPTYLEKSKLAIVPVGRNFPSDWKPWADIFSARRTRYRNVCDVIYKTEKSIQISPKNSFGELMNDEMGNYRTLKGPASITHLQDSTRLSLRFEGKMDALQILIPDSQTKPEIQTHQTGAITEITYLWKQSHDLPTSVQIQGRWGKKIRIRKISWDSPVN